MSPTTLPAGGNWLTIGRWWPVLVGFVALYLPAYVEAWDVIWQTDDHAHGPIVLAVSGWLFWSKRAELAAVTAPQHRGLAWSVLALGLLFFVAGRALSSAVLVFGAQPLVVAGGLALIGGRPALRMAWFPIFYLVFMIPLPSVLVDALTGPLKQWVSVITESLLYTVGYPIARSGVTITVGQYQLLVADACSGLHSMFSLAALGTLFMYLMGRPSRLHNALMIAAIAPIAFGANVVRVIVLILVTYHLGDEAGQGFLHGAAGIVLMLVALVAFAALDALLFEAARRLRAPRTATSP